MNDFMLGAAVRAQAELSSYGGGTVTSAASATASRSSPAT